MKRLDIYRRLFSYLKPYRLEVALVYGAMLTGLVARLFIPQAIRSAIDNGLAAGNSEALVRSGMMILVVAVLSGLVSFLFFYFGHWLSHRVAYDIRNDFYTHIQRLPFSFHDTAHTGDLMSRATNDITEMEWFVGLRFADLLNVVLTITGVVIAMLLQNWQLALIGLIPFPILAFLTVRFGSIVRPMFKEIQEYLGQLSTTMQESLTGIRVVKAFAREPYELEKFDEKNDAWFEKRSSLIKVWASNWPLFTFLVGCSVFLLLWFGSPRVVNNPEVTVGVLFALISYVLMLQQPVQQLGFVVNLAATAGASAGRVFEIMDQPNDVTDRLDAHALTNTEGAVAFENITFGYVPENTILHNISFDVPAGQRVALVGPTGSGKSTIINLLPRFYEQNATSSGRITIDGQDIRTLTGESLRRSIGTVLQNSFLFSSTIAENIAYGNPTADRASIEAAAQAACAHDFIMGFPDGYDTVVGERGVTLSGGQKQRVAIARTLLVNPRILILDDSLSSVDTETEHLIQQALDTLMHGRTTFIIAQRLLTLKDADQILVLDDGRIVETGTHDQLLAQAGLYRDIYDLQLRDQEEFAAVQANFASFSGEN